MKSIPTFVLVCCINSLFPQQSTLISLAEAGACLGGLSALHSNPAGLVNEEPTSFSLDHRQIGIENLLSESSVGSMYSGEKYALGILLKQKGDQRLAIRNYGLSYARKFSPAFKTGINLSLHEWSFSDIYGVKRALGSEFGLQYKFNNQCQLGLIIENPLQRRVFDATDERLNASISAGIRYSPNVKFSLFFEQEFSSNFGGESKLAFEYLPLEQLHLRGGYQIEKRRLSCGLSVELKHWIYQFAIVYHAVSGMSASTGISFSVR